MKERIVIVEDDRLKRLTLAQELKDTGYEVVPCENAFQALERLAESETRAVVTDLRLPGMDGIALLKELKKSRPHIGVIVVTAYGSIDTAIEAIRSGAYDYILKPFTIEELDLKLRHLIERGRLLGELAVLRAAVVEWCEFGNIVASSKAMREVIDRARSVAPTTAPVLIQGETGTGKELLARAIHLHGGNPARPFVAFNGATLNANLIESELFGHEAGAFTGAVRQRRGRMELAEDGTLFLDDIDDFPIETQVKLLRVLQERRFERVGGEKSLEMRARLICSTKRDLRDMAAQGRFREDLLYRIDVVCLVLPPLRARTTEIPQLFTHFWRRHGAGECRLDPETLQILLTHDWPGNVRELENVVRHARVFAVESAVTPACLPPYLTHLKDEKRLWRFNLTGHDRVDLPRVIEEIEVEATRWAMVKTGGNLSRAAELLNLPRTTLRRHLTAPAPPPSAAPLMTAKAQPD